jgi:deoxyribonuclease V
MRSVIAAFDVHYFKGGASAAAVLFSNYADEAPLAEYQRMLARVAAYVPGQFYKRELPCILALIERIDERIEAMIVDGYVRLGDRPGLGRHLFESFDGGIPVIGVAKSGFKGARGTEVCRGRSLRPLYVTSAGLNQEAAAENIRRMHGPYRIPTLLKRADQLARGNARNDV